MYPIYNFRLVLLAFAFGCLTRFFAILLQRQTTYFRLTGAQKLSVAPPMQTHWPL